MSRAVRTIALALALAASGPVLARQAGSPPAVAPDPAAPAGQEQPRGPRAAEDKEQLARRLDSVSRLIESSSAARQIDSAANPQAQAQRSAARVLRQQAQDAYQAGNVAAASALLDQAAQALFAGARLAAPEQLVAAKQRREFDARMESVTALLAAQQRISTEKNAGPAARDASAALEAQRRAAAALAAAGQLDQAKVQLDKVYLTTKLSIESMRKGDTLVRSLQFASKEEEYQYEIDRYDTHKMLVKMLLDEKRSSNAGLDGMVQKNLEQAARLRADADAMAAKKDFGAGVSALEDATRELVRAIRGAGVYIPG